METGEFLAISICCLHTTNKRIDYCVKENLASQSILLTNIMFICKNLSEETVWTENDITNLSSDPNFLLGGNLTLKVR
jgi:hypothetical protein